MLCWPETALKICVYTGVFASALALAWHKCHPKNLSQPVVQNWCLVTHCRGTVEEKFYTYFHVTRSLNSELKSMKIMYM